MSLCWRFWLYLDEACVWLGIQHGIMITLPTLCWNLLDAGLSHKILWKLAAKHNKVLCKDFKTMLWIQFVGDGSEFVVIDETNKNKHTYICMAVWTCGTWWMSSHYRHLYPGWLLFIVCCIDYWRLSCNTCNSWLIQCWEVLDFVARRL